MNKGINFPRKFENMIESCSNCGEKDCHQIDENTALCDACIRELLNNSNFGGEK